MKRPAELFSLMLASSLAYGQSPPVGLPALDEGGLVALFALIAVVGGLVARRRKK